eukprot:TRINITY_DN56166_c0_g1_i1.p1 TRINITY_DN56166_c0_g1~~TRINITY_DN56166_c0_g1_i1.p1  ORF type:complete len:428 (+),score=108.10 TRINITY_DN56166_c0_g1_i1:115-1398(+)
MSVLTLQIGQCGNQLGLEIFDRIAEAARHCSDQEQELASRAFFREPPHHGQPPVARAVLVDMEPKVIERCVAGARRSGVFHYGSQRIFTRDEGSANNWAFGYHVQALCCAADVMEQARKEVERMDALQAVLMLHSVAGGTGSGVGSCIQEHLLDTMPGPPLVSVPVLPLATGEIALQHYNALLALSGVLRNCDLALPFSNSDVVDLCRGPLGVPHPSLDDLNRSIAFDVVSAALFPSSWEPATGAAPGPFGSRRPLPLRPLADLCRHVAPDPRRKLATAASAPRGAQNAAQRGHEGPSWNQAVQELRRAVPCDGGAALLTVRGKVAEPPQGFSRVRTASPTDLFGAECRVARSGAVAAGPAGGCVAVCADSPRPAAGLRRLLERCRDMLGWRAYVHHYHRFGVEDADFADAILTLEQAAKDMAPRRR